MERKDELIILLKSTSYSLTIELNNLISCISYEREISVAMENVDILISRYNSQKEEYKKISFN